MSAFTKDDVERSVFMEKLDKIRETSGYKLFAFWIAITNQQKGKNWASALNE